MQPEDALAPALLAWWDDHGRKDLPWQHNTTPYRVWVSEIMLQQTQVTTVMGYYDRFMQAFPSVEALAAADDDEVMHLWSGLGYYSRARNLHKAAKAVVDDHGGEFPSALDELTALPGIGRSTAGAIRSLAFGEREPILDGNVKRVLARVFAIEGWPGKTAVLKALWEKAEACTPHERVGHYTQAIMDLGATLCRRGRPDCERCPLQSICTGFAQGNPADYPGRKPKAKTRRQEHTVMLIIASDEGFLLEKRPPTGIWGNLWSFPEVSAAADAAALCQEVTGKEPREVRELAGVSHSFSHFDLDITPLLLTVSTPDGAVMEGDRWLWYNTAKPAGVGLAAPVARLLKAAGEEQ